MDKTPEFKTLEQELILYKETIDRASEIIQDQDVSGFPIFVFHKNLVDIGINIVDKDAAGGSWSVNASTLEEFVAKQIIAPEKIEDFKLLYKTHSGDLCLFVLNELGANFIFLSR